MGEKVAGLVVAGGSVSAFTVLLGRLWTSSYFEYFGLPVSDLTLEVQDYAFRTKEILVMLVLAGALLAGIGWRAEKLGISPPGRGPWSGLHRFWAGLGIAVVVFFVGFFVLDATSSLVLQDWWRWLTVGLGIALGVGAGLVVGYTRLDGRPWAWILAAGVIMVLVVLVPFAIVRLARASAARDVRTQNLAHVVLQFEETAPVPIRRADDPSRSTRVYLVLSTPERLAVAFPYPCTQVGTADEADEARGDGSRSSDLCDILTFDRSLVAAIEIVGKGGRPSNDEAVKAEPVTLGVGAIGQDDFAPRVVYDQGYDFSLAARNTIRCRAGDGSSAELSLHGVWLRLDALQAGRVEVVDRSATVRTGSSGERSREAKYLLLDVDDETACHEVSDGRRIRVDANGVARLFIGMERVDHEGTRRQIRLRFTPLDVRAGDCRVAKSPDAEAAASCPDQPPDSVGLRVHVPAGAQLSATVELANAGFEATSDNQCPEEAPPFRAFAGGNPLVVLGCQPSPIGAEAVSVVLGAFAQGGTDGIVEIVACAHTGSGPRIEGVRVSLSLPAEVMSTTPPADGADAADGNGGGGVPEPPPPSVPASETTPVTPTC